MVFIPVLLPSPAARYCRGVFSLTRDYTAIGEDEPAGPDTEDSMAGDIRLGVIVPSINTVVEESSWKTAIRRGQSSV
jgi:hypothetical protein